MICCLSFGSRQREFCITQSMHIELPKNLCYIEKGKLLQTTFKVLLFDCCSKIFRNASFSKALQNTGEVIIFKKNVGFEWVY
jgi:hypothetical protein